MKLSISILLNYSSTIGILSTFLQLCSLTGSESVSAQHLSTMTEDTSTSSSKTKINDKERSPKHIFWDRNLSLRTSLTKSPLEDLTKIVGMTHVVWADFVLLPREINRAEDQLLDSNVSKTFRLCAQETVTNLSKKLGSADFEWCKWSLREDGGKVKVLSTPPPVTNYIVD